MSRVTSEGQQMIDVRQAVKIAREFVQSAYEGEQLKELRLEEIDRSEDDNWLITFGFDTNRLNDPSPLEVFSVSLPNRPRFVRDYKVIEVDANSGEVVSMKIRTV